MAAKVIAGGLMELGIMKGDVEEAGQIRRRFLKEYLVDVKSLF